MISAICIAHELQGSTADLGSLPDSSFECLLTSIEPTNICAPHVQVADDQYASRPDDRNELRQTCASCAARIEKKLNRIEGVNATVNYATEKATVHAGTGTTAQALIETIEKTGYRATLPAESPRDPDLELRQLRRRLIITAALSVPVIMIAMVPAWQFPWWQWISFALTCVIVTWGAWPFHRATLLNLQHSNATMDTLISVGTLAAFGWSAYALFFGVAGEIGFTHPFEFQLVRHAPTANLYLEAALASAFLLLGRYLGATGADRARRSRAARPDTISGRADIQRRVVVDVSELHVGDRFVVRPGDGWH
jgi:Cu+-exporting ATPase